MLSPDIFACLHVMTRAFPVYTVCRRAVVDVGPPGLPRLFLCVYVSSACFFSPFPLFLFFSLVSLPSLFLFFYFSPYSFLFLSLFLCSCSSCYELRMGYDPPRRVIAGLYIRVHVALFLLSVRFVSFPFLFLLFVCTCWSLGACVRA